MNPSTLAILLHLGSLLRLLKDIEQGVEHVIKGQASTDDLKLILQDVAGLLEMGVINIPGMTKEQIAMAVADLKQIA